MPAIKQAMLYHKNITTLNQSLYCIVLRNVLIIYRCTCAPHSACSALVCCSFRRIGRFLSTTTTLQSGLRGTGLPNCLDCFEGEPAQICLTGGAALYTTLFLSRNRGRSSLAVLSASFSSASFPLPVGTHLFDAVPALDLLIGVLSRDGCAGGVTALTLGLVFAASVSSASLSLALWQLFFGLVISSSFRFLVTYCSTEVRKSVFPCQKVSFSCLKEA